MEVTQARLSLHLSKCHIVGNHISTPTIYLVSITELGRDGADTLTETNNQHGQDM